MLKLILIYIALVPITFMILAFNSVFNVAGSYLARVSKNHTLALIRTFLFSFFIIFISLLFLRSVIENSFGVVAHPAMLVLPFFAILIYDLRRLKKVSTDAEVIENFKKQDMNPLLQIKIEKTMLAAEFVSFICAALLWA